MLSDEQGSPGLPVLRDISDAAALPVMQGSLMAANSPGRVLIRLIQVLTGPPRINKRSTSDGTAFVTGNWITVPF
jgi:hypothetical protein